MKLFGASERLLKLASLRCAETEGVRAGPYVHSAVSFALSLYSCYPAVTGRRLIAAIECTLKILLWQDLSSSLLPPVVDFYKFLCCGPILNSLQHLKIKIIIVSLSFKATSRNARNAFPPLIQPFRKC